MPGKINHDQTIDTLYYVTILAVPVLELEAGLGLAIDTLYIRYVCIEYLWSS